MGKDARMTKLLVATRNAHKTREIAAILGPKFSVTDLTQVCDIPATIESGETFEENAALKATEASLLFNGLVLADDSGLEVDALGGAPGVRSARYAGEEATDEANRRHLISELDHLGIPSTPQPARFHCVLVLAQRGKVLASFHGRVEGAIQREERGAGGFGYDPLFVPEGFRETFAELPAETKNQLSHRARALAQLRDYLAV